MANKIEYSKLLNRKEWKKKRLSILKRDNNKCTCCGYGLRLIVHHKYYNNYPDGTMLNPWEYPDSTLITVCYSCHKNIHRTTRIVVRYIEKPKNYGKTF